MIKIAITGVIGSGKSTLANIFKRLGYTVIDADEISRTLTKKGTDVYSKILEAFGRDILDEKGEIDRKRLASIVFADPKRRKELENIIHPAVRAERNRIIEKMEREDKDSIVILDIPLLFETGMEREVDYVILAYADEKTLYERVKKRDQMSYEEFLRRLQNQMPLSEKAEKSHFVIDTRKSIGELEEEVIEIIKKIRSTH